MKVHYEKSTICFYTTFVITFFLVVCFGFPVQALTGNEIIEKADKVMLGNTAKYVSVMVIKRPDVPDLVAKYHTYFNGRGEKVMVRMLYPPQNVGKDLLLVGENMWQYIPNIERSVRVAGTQRFMGGDFNNSDLLKVSLVKDYDGTLVDVVTIDKIKCYYLELSAKRSSATYDRVLYWVRTEGFYPYKEEYYTLSGKKMKTLVFSDIGKLHKLVRPRRLVMINALRPKHLTIVQITDAEYDIPINDSLFTRTYLERKRN